MKRRKGCGPRVGFAAALGFGVWVLVAGCAESEPLTPVVEPEQPIAQQGPPSCDDANPCTADIWDDDRDACVYEERTGPCELGDRCLTAGLCAGGVCVGTPVVCEVPSACHVGSCDAELGCVVEAVHSRCDDGDPCTEDTCSPSGCIHARQPEGYPCAGEGGCVGLAFCAQGACVPAAEVEGYPCDDGDPCTDGETCQGLSCGGGTPSPAQPPSLVERWRSAGNRDAGVARVGTNSFLLYDRLATPFWSDEPDMAVLSVVRVEAGEAYLVNQRTTEHRYERDTLQPMLIPLGQGRALLRDATRPPVLVTVAGAGQLSISDKIGLEPVVSGALLGNILYVAQRPLAGAPSLRVYNVANPNAPTLLEDLDVRALSLRLDAERERLYADPNGLEPVVHLDLSDPTLPVEVEAPVTTYTVELDPYDATHALVRQYSGSAQLVSADDFAVVSDPDLPLEGWADLALLRGNRIIGVSRGSTTPEPSLWIARVDMPEAEPVVVAGVHPSLSDQIDATSTTVAIANRDHGVRMFDVATDPPTPLEPVWLGPPGALVPRGPGQAPALVRRDRMATVDVVSGPELSFAWAPDLFADAALVRGPSLGDAAALFTPRFPWQWYVSSLPIWSLDEDGPVPVGEATWPASTLCSRAHQPMLCLRYAAEGTLLEAFDLEDIPPGADPLPARTISLAGILGDSPSLEHIGLHGSTLIVVEPHAVERIPASVRVFDVTEQDDLVEVGSVMVSGAIRPVRIAEDRAILSTKLGLTWIDLHPPSIAYELDAGGAAGSVVVHQGRLWAAADDEVVVLEPGCPGP